MTLGGGFSDRGGGSCGGDTRRDGGGSVSCGGGGAALVGASVAVHREGFDVGGWPCGGDDAQLEFDQCCQNFIKSKTICQTYVKFINPRQNRASKTSKSLILWDGGSSKYMNRQLNCILLGKKLFN
uniref:Uncharacterized protein n=1 Tax=Oryza glumipatula TaxID=40148 RepID=A0A0E0B1M3_9ORYZ